MASIVKCAVKTSDFNSLLNTIGVFYHIESSKKSNIREVDGFIPNKRIVILSDEVSKDWIQLIFAVNHPFELDELLRKVTYSLKTNGFFIYKQTTSGDFRFAQFKMGKITRSYYTKYVEFHKELRVIEDFGPSLLMENGNAERYFKNNSRLNQELNYENINTFFDQVGFIWDGSEKSSYYYLVLSGFK